MYSQVQPAADGMKERNALARFSVTGCQPTASAPNSLVTRDNEGRSSRRYSASEV
jgi:hypothetical protein